MTISNISSATLIPSIVSNEIDKVKISNNYSSSIGKATEATPPETGLFSPPILLIMNLMEETYAIGNGLLQTATDEIKYLSESLSKKMTENIEALRKAATLAQASDVWSILQKIGTSVFAATNLFLGYSALGNSPELGSALIASGILSVTNLLMTELKGWDKIADTLVQENVEFKKNLAFWAPISLTCLSGALTAFSGPSVLFNPDLFRSSLSFDPNFCMKMYQSATTAGSSVTEAMFSWSKADLSSIQNTIFSDVSLQDAIASWVQSFLKLLEHGWEQARHIIQLTSQLRM